MLCILISGCKSKQESLDISTKNLNIFLDKTYPSAINRYCLGYEPLDTNNYCTAKLGDKLIKFYCMSGKVNGVCYF